MDVQPGVHRPALTNVDGDRRDLEHLVVHNLKSPLTGLLATLEMLADGDFGELNARQQRAVHDMQGHGGQLIVLLDELLDIGRMESASVPTDAHEVDIALILDAIRDAWILRLGDRLEVTAAADLPVAIGDPIVLRRVIDNLLLNTIMHGGPSVHVRCVASGAGDRVLIKVSDDGPGIPAGQTERVFEKFVRLDPAPGASHRGSGLGLAYCRAAMQAMGGRISLDTEGAQGATFMLELPARPRDEGRA
jgi:signal transduction histidine kinase